MRCGSWSSWALSPSFWVLASLFCVCWKGFESYLGESNVGGLLTEALTADVEAVLADETGRVSADAAIEKNSMSAFALRL